MQMKNERNSRYSFMAIFILIKSNRFNSDCIMCEEFGSQLLDGVDYANEIEVRRSHIVKDAIRVEKNEIFP